MLEKAQLFGKSLDQDDFAVTATLLSDDCVYNIGETQLIGPDAICGSYEQNMIEGRKKLDELKWGDSRIETVNDSTYLVHFTDYLKHQGQSYTHRCQQQLTFGIDGLISQIDHIDDPSEAERLNNYYKKVGLK